MESVWYLWIVVFLIIIWSNISERRAQRARAIVRTNKLKRLKGEKSIMKELVKQFIGKDCVIYTMNASSAMADGIIVEVSEDGGAIIVEKPVSMEREIVNLDYVTRIKPIPYKNGKRKNIW